MAGEEVIDMVLPAASRILDHLGDVAYPATREDLVDYARKAHAPGDIMWTLERRYASPEIVIETIGMM
jgi:hypothetical protein